MRNVVRMTIHCSSLLCPGGMREDNSWAGEVDFGNDSVWVSPDCPSLQILAFLAGLNSCLLTERPRTLIYGTTV